MQPGLDHVAVENNWNGEEETDPEPLAEHLLVSAVVGMRGVFGVFGMIEFAPVYTVVHHGLFVLMVRSHLVVSFGVWHLLGCGMLALRGRSVALSMRVRGVWMVMMLFHFRVPPGSTG